jgi:DNA-binding response OmpR family regulator
MEEKKYTVMVVEDEALLLQAINLKFKKVSINVISCATGEQAFKYLEDLEKLPDAIWLDYYLTDMDGLDFIQKLKTHEDWLKIPVIVVSNSASDEKTKNMLALGIKKYIIKADYRLEEIVDILETVIKENL